jgi:hypothetical protein
VKARSVYKGTASTQVTHHPSTRSSARLSATTASRPIVETDCQVIIAFIAATL